MKNVGHFSIILVFGFVAMVFNHSSSLYAQRASAEFISSIGPTSLETGQDLKDGIQNVTYKDNILYVINVWAGIQAVDVSDRQRPREIGKYLNEHRAHNLHIDDRYGYLSDELAGVHILDISDPAVITRIALIETEGNAFWAVGDYPYVYVAEEEKGISIYDITDTSNPSKIGGYDTPGWAWEMILRDNILYVADKSEGLQILDVTDKMNPKRLGQYLGTKNARSIALDGNNLYLANGAECVCVIDVSNPKFPTLISQMEVSGYIADVFPSGKNLFVANETKLSMEIFDISALPNLTPGGQYQAEDKVYGLWKEDVYVFVAANTKSLVLRYNSPPKLVAIPDTVINEQQILTIQAQAYDPDGDILYYEFDNMPEGAQFDTSRGVLSWTPTFEQSGEYSDLTMRVIEYTDSRLTDEHRFTVTVNHVNRPPSLPEVEDYTILENELLTIEVPEGKDEDREDQGKLVYSAENVPQGAVFNSAKRILTWTPDYDQSGTYVLDFVLSDQAGGVDRDASTITVQHVDRNPVITAVENKTIDENTTLEFSLSGSDPDIEDQNAISFEVIGLPEGASFDPTTNKVNWIPTYDQSGVYENILLIMRAGNLADSTAMQITVNHVNRPPVLDEIADKMIDENKNLSFNISGSDPDVEDSGKLSFMASGLPQGASFDADSLRFSWTPDYDQAGLYENVTFTVTDPSGISKSRMMKITVNHVNRPPVLAEIEPQTVNENTELIFNLQGSDEDQEDQDNLQYSAKQMPEGALLEMDQFKWTPGYEQSGEYTVEFTMSDGQLTDSESTVITVLHVNRPPVIEPIQAQIVDENKPLEIKIVGSDPDTEDAGGWNITTGELPPGAVFTAESALLTWTPTFDQSGTYTIPVTITDPQGLTATQDIKITVNHVNRMPVLSPIEPQMAKENTPLSVVLPQGEDPDTEDAEKLVYQAENLPQGASFDGASRTLNWTPGYDQSGTYEIPISLSDGEFTSTQTLKLTVENVNRPPVITEISDQTAKENESFTYTIEVNDPDIEDDGKLQTTATNLPQGMAFNAASNQVTWTPTFDQSGVYQGITFSVRDQAGLEANQSFNLTVDNVNRPPQINAVSDQTVAENTPLNIGLQGNDPDQEDEGKLKYSAEGLPQGAAVDPVSGSISWTPDFTQAGNYPITARLTDAEGLSAETSFLIEVTDVNRPPQIQDIGAQNVDEQASLTFSLSATDEDTDNELKFSIDNLPDGASLDEGSGNFSWTPDYDQAGDYSLMAMVSDGTAESSTSIAITVNDVNRKPQIEDGGSETITVGESVSLSFSASDPDGDQLTFTGSGLPSGATLDSGNGQFTWTPDEDQTGRFTITVSVSDGKDSAEATATVNVNPKPEPEPEPETVPEEQQPQN